MKRSKRLRASAATPKGGPAGIDYRAYAGLRLPPSLRKRRIILVFLADQGKIWKLLDDLDDDEVAAKLPAQFRRLPERVVG